MTADFYPLRETLAGWSHREHQGTIEYLVEENGTLKGSWREGSCA